MPVAPCETGLAKRRQPLSPGVMRPPSVKRENNPSPESPGFPEDDQRCEGQGGMSLIDFPVQAQTLPGRDCPTHLWRLIGNGDNGGDR